MASAKQIKARKAFVKKYAKKGKKGSPKSKKSGGAKAWKPSKSASLSKAEYAKLKLKMRYS